jgi:hypothetical protein
LVHDLRKARAHRLSPEVVRQQDLSLALIDDASRSASMKRAVFFEFAPFRMITKTQPALRRGGAPPIGDRVQNLPNPLFQ